MLMPLQHLGKVINFPWDGPCRLKTPKPFFCFYFFVVCLFVCLEFLLQEPPPPMVPGPTISRRDGSSTSQVYASPIVIYHSSGTPAQNYSSPTVKPLCHREPPLLAQCDHNTPICLATCYGQEYSSTVSAICLNSQIQKDSTLGYPKIFLQNS